MEKEAKKEKSRDKFPLILANALSPLPILVAYLICRKEGEIDIGKMAPLVIVGYSIIALAFYVWSKFSREKEGL